jgi:hypothetical protein
VDHLDLDDCVLEVGRRLIARQTALKTWIPRIKELCERGVPLDHALLMVAPGVLLLEEEICGSLDEFEVAIRESKNPGEMQAEIGHALSRGSAENRAIPADNPSGSPSARATAAAVVELSRKRGADMRAHARAMWAERDAAATRRVAQSQRVGCRATRISIPRQRERRDGSRRHATRGGTDDDASGEPGGLDPEAESPARQPRICAAPGCTNEIPAGSRSDRLTCTDACRQALFRQNAPHRRWSRTLLLARDIDRVKAALADGKIAPATGDRLLALLTAKRLQLLRAGRQTPVDGCEHRAVAADPDGDSICLHCGHYVGRIAASINGYDAMAALMSQRPEPDHVDGRVMA